MAVTRFKHVKPALQAGLDLIVLADPQFWAGISAALEVARMCKGSVWVSAAIVTIIRASP